MRRLSPAARDAGARRAGRRRRTTSPRRADDAEGHRPAVDPAIVRIEAESDGDKVGTGFILDKTGLVATNLHVVAGKQTIRVKLARRHRLPGDHDRGRRPGRDLAVLRIAPTKPLRRCGSATATDVRRRSGRSRSATRSACSTTRCRAAWSARSARCARAGRASEVVERCQGVAPRRGRRAECAASRS